MSFSLIKDLDFVERPLCYSCIQITLERLEKYAHWMQREINMDIGPKKAHTSKIKTNRN